VSRLRVFKSRPQAMPVFVDAWLGSQSISLMTPEEEGAYVRLLLHAWRSDTCTLPADDASLAILSRLNDRWNGCSARVRACFTICLQDPSRLVNGKLYKIRLQHEGFWQQKREAGLSSGQARAKHGNGRSTDVQRPLGSRCRSVRTSSASASASASSTSSDPSSSLEPSSVHRAGAREGEGFLKKPSEGRRTDGRRVSLEDLRDDTRLEVCYRRAVSAGVISGSRAEREHYWAAAVHALARDPVGAPNLFCWLVKSKAWDKITEAEEDEGHGRLKRIEAGGG
jgi:uncharacterized protein YdaU (DUF1376 family)